MSKSITLLCVLLFSLFSVASDAAGQKQDPCTNPQTTFDMRNCAGKSFQESDEKLNRVYKNLMQRIEDTGEKSALKSAQLDWLKYRDSNCEFESFQNRGGTIYPVVYETCRARMTDNRTKELQDRIKEMNAQ